jgi:hypothetical protein
MKTWFLAFITAELWQENGLLMLAKTMPNLKKDTFLHIYVVVVVVVLKYSPLSSAPSSRTGRCKWRLLISLLERVLIAELLVILAYHLINHFLSLEMLKC